MDIIVRFQLMKSNKWLLKPMAIRCFFQQNNVILIAKYIAVTRIDSRALASFTIELARFCID